MYKDILNIIEKYTSIDLIKYKYHCEECSEKLNYNEILSCIYLEDNENITITFNDEIEIYKKICNYSFKYICSSCYDAIYKYKEIQFIYSHILELESFENLLNEIIMLKKKEIEKKCIFQNISIQENNESDYYKSLFTLYDFKENTIIEINIFYANDESFDKYYEKLSKTIKEYFRDFKIEKYLEITN